VSWKAAGVESSIPGAPGVRGGTDGGRASKGARTVDACKQYGIGDAAVHALRGVSVEFAAGTFSAIMGPSGSGKSTLLHCTAGLDRLSSGQAFIGDLEVSNLSENDAAVMRRNRVGFVFQSFNLLPTMSAIENITLPFSISRTAIDAAWIGYLVDLLGLGDRLDHRPAELSGGQQQRVAVARALAPRPEIVFADEPTGNLDTKAGTELLELLADVVRTSGQTVVMVSHDPRAVGFTDRVVFLVDGRLVGELVDPTPDTVLDHMRIHEAR
jgi:putative ABC transport system ATP-binding protein